jgi:hypothetical protein
MSGLLQSFREPPPKAHRYVSLLSLFIGCGAGAYYRDLAAVLIVTVIAFIALGITYSVIARLVGTRPLRIIDVVSDLVSFLSSPW